MSVVLDCALAVGCAVVGFLMVFDGVESGNQPPVPISAPVLEMVAAATGLAVVARRRWPSVVAIITLAWYLVLFNMPWVATVAMYSLAVHARPRRTTLVATASLLAICVRGVIGLPVQCVPGRCGVALFLGIAFLLGKSLAFTVAAPVAFGLFIATRQRLVQRLEQQQTLLADRARSEERARLAREMHDVVAHKVSLMTLHAGSMEVARDPHPGEVRRTGALISHLGREAVDELRHVIGLLNAGTRDLTRLDDLLDQSRRAGMTITARTEGQPRPLPVIIEHAAYRVIQEALTNVHKHAGATQIGVTIRYLPTELAVSVINAPGRAVTAHAGTRRGLDGLRDRIHELDGTFHAGPQPAGGFAVHVRIPA